MIRAGVIGHPLAHTLSPMIHGHWLKAYGIDGSYKAIPVAPEELEARVAGLAAEGYAGFNVTLPHKETIIPLCATLDETARLVGAVNLVTIKPEGTLHGSNTDMAGMIENLRAARPGIALSASRAVVLGAGGAGRAALAGLLNADPTHVILLNRTRARAEKLADSFDHGGRVSVADWAARGDVLAGADLLINTTSMGMTGQPPLEIALDELSTRAVVYDIVYRPLMTPLLQAAQARGNPVVTGIGMLLHQARPAFAAWFGVTPDIDAELERALLDRLGS